MLPTFRLQLKKLSLASICCCSGIAAALLTAGSAAAAAEIAFVAARELPLAATLQVQNALAVAAADFDGDGDPDLAALSRVGDGNRPNRVSVLLNRSGGNFAAGGSYEVGTGDAGALVTGDFDGNGDPDLALTNRTDGTVSVLLGRRGSRFAAPVSFAAGEQPVGLAVGEAHSSLKCNST
ncbi:MAG: VCBS repeat-containing protein [Aphanocapsa lilacina HA4352-LM1]|nr:VCBS repeat-containing protein [Aphanocapsa lilacina HA4352-LM1]